MSFDRDHAVFSLLESFCQNTYQGLFAACETGDEGCLSANYTGDSMRHATYACLLACDMSCCVYSHMPECLVQVACVISDCLAHLLTAADLCRTGQNDAWTPCSKYAILILCSKYLAQDKSCFIHTTHCGQTWCEMVVPECFVLKLSIRFRRTSRPKVLRIHTFATSMPFKIIYAFASTKRTLTLARLFCMMLVCHAICL